MFDQPSYSLDPTTTVDAHPLSRVLISMSGAGSKTAATILLTTGDFISFPAPGHLAAYAGIAPVTRRLGASTRASSRPSPATNRLRMRYSNLLGWPPVTTFYRGPTYYDRKRVEGKKYGDAVICLARRQLNVLYAMVRDGSFHQVASENIPQGA